ncbi:uncharacterized protein EV154DRAFT_532148, partial [Mucor mucedo]|uniref:uncharacterized protein n=1 Tax=Mucor mucedo TaxID=29922 RepID=UPI00221EC1A2
MSVIVIAVAYFYLANAFHTCKLWFFFLEKMIRACLVRRRCKPTLFRYYVYACAAVLFLKQTNYGRKADIPMRNYIVAIKRDRLI